MTDYIKALLNRDDPASFGHAIALLIVAALLVWGTWLVGTGKGIADVPWGWIAVLALFMGTTNGPEIIAAVKAVKGAPNEPAGAK